MQQTSAHGRTACCNWSGWKNRTWWFHHLHQGLLPGHSGMEGVSSRVIFEPSASKKQKQRPFIFISDACIVATTLVSMELLPCAASSTWTWVNPLLTLVQWLGWCRTTTYYNFETWSDLGHLFARFAITSWRSTERPEDFFSESVVSHLVPWVSSCVVLVLFLVGFVLFWIWKTPGFLLSPILQYVGIANQRQNVLMTVRASSVHGMSSKKNVQTCNVTRIQVLRNAWTSSPLEAPFKLPSSWRLQAPFKPPWSPLEDEAPFKPPSSCLEAPFNAEGFKPPSTPWSPLEAPFKPPWSPLQGKAPFKPPSSPLEAPLLPSEGEAPFDLRPPPSPDPSSPLEGGFWRGYLGTSPMKETRKPCNKACSSAIQFLLDSKLLLAFLPPGILVIPLCTLQLSVSWALVSKTLWS